MNELDSILKEFNKTAYKPTTEEILQSEIVRVEAKVDTIDTDLNSRIEAIESELTDKVETALAIAETTKKEKGDKGDSYVLTESDKLDIAKQILVPVVEKVIERTETIREIPTITENTIVNEVAVKDTGEEILAKINELPVTEEYQIDASRIKNLPEIQNVRAGGLSKAYADKLYVPIGSGGGSSTWGSITGTLSDQTDLQTALNDKLDNATASTTYVPYTGATGNVDLGANNVTATNIVATGQVQLPTGTGLVPAVSFTTEGVGLFAEGTYATHDGYMSIVGTDGTTTRTIAKFGGDLSGNNPDVILGAGGSTLNMTLSANTNNLRFLDKGAGVAIFDGSGYLQSTALSNFVTPTFETVSSNLPASDATLNYTSGDISSIVYSNGITKTFNYTSGNVTSIVLSGSTPGGIELTKTLTYDGSGNVDTIVYS